MGGSIEISSAYEGELARVDCTPQDNPNPLVPTSCHAGSDGLRACVNVCVSAGASSATSAGTKDFYCAPALPTCPLPRGARATVGEQRVTVQAGSTTVPVSYNPGVNACVDVIEWLLYGVFELMYGRTPGTDPCPFE